MSLNQALCVPSPPPLPRSTTNPPNIEPVVSTSSNEEQVLEACRRRGLNTSLVGKRFHLRSISPILQNGPTCGPVALAMLLGQSPDSMVQLARARRFTNNGEMFSCKDMAKLTQTAVDRLAMPVHVSVHTGDLCSENVVRLLLEGAAMLVPYDADFNHSPCLRRGNKAHWALIVGVVASGHASDALVLARHGKSAHLAVWGLQDLAASNDNLVEFPAHRESDSLSYVKPPGGVGGERGLRSQYIIVRDL